MYPTSDDRNKGYPLEQPLDKPYIVQQKDTNLYKIGLANSIDTRIKQLQTGNPNKLLLKAYSTGNSEKEVHLSLYKYQKEGEWFELDDDGLKIASRIMAKFSPELCTIFVR